MLFQEHPFECQSNYASIGAIRCNFDAQDMRRILPTEHWMAEGEDLPHIGSRDHWGYMNVYEWDGEAYVQALHTHTLGPFDTFVGFGKSPYTCSSHLWPLMYFHGFE